MKTLLPSLSLLLLASCASVSGDSEGPSGGIPATPLPASPDLDLTGASVRVLPELGLLVFEIQVAGSAGATIPSPRGQLDGAPVLGYVFPTTLKSQDVGFGEVEGIVALALTSHPDFDDTPLFDEDANGDYGNDGGVWHPHWVLLGSDDRVPGGLSVQQFDADDETVVLPPTNPGMPMYMDSPGFPVAATGSAIRVTVPLYRVSGRTDFRFDAVAAYMQVNGSDPERPMLGVYEVYDVLSGDLSLPFSVQR